MQTNYITNASHPEFLKQISERKKKGPPIENILRGFCFLFVFGLGFVNYNHKAF